VGEGAWLGVGDVVGVDGDEQEGEAAAREATLKKAPARTARRAQPNKARNAAEASTSGSMDGGQPFFFDTSIKLVTTERLFDAVCLVIVRFRIPQRKESSSKSCVRPAHRHPNPQAQTKEGDSATSAAAGSSRHRLHELYKK
jgi:hypothetical protein